MKHVQQILAEDFHPQGPMQAIAVFILQDYGAHLHVEFGEDDLDYFRAAYFTVGEHIASVYNYAGSPPDLFELSVDVGSIYGNLEPEVKAVFDEIIESVLSHINVDISEVEWRLAS